jgi:hypothetical protein
VFIARYALSPYIKQIRFVFKGLINASSEGHIRVVELFHPVWVLYGIVFCYECKTLQISMSVFIITSIFIFVIFARVGIFVLCQVQQLSPPPPLTSAHIHASLQQNSSIKWFADPLNFNGRTIRRATSDRSYNSLQEWNISDAFAKRHFSFYG